MRILLVAVLCWVFCCKAEKNDVTAEVPATPRLPLNSTDEDVPIGCVCGVFLSGQFKKGSKGQPTGFPAFIHEHSEVFPCNPTGNKLCTNKCLDQVKFIKSTLPLTQLPVLQLK